MIGELLPIMSCEGCGACCTKIAIPPFDEFEGRIDTNDFEWQKLPQHLRDEINTAWNNGITWGIGRPCIWLDPVTRRCREYNHRPVCCSRFDPGNPTCLEMRKEQGIAQ